MKRNIIDLMVMNKIEDKTTTEELERLILGFHDSGKIRGIPNEIFPLVILNSISNFEISRVLIDDINSYYIMYSDLFKKMGLKKEK